MTRLVFVFILCFGVKSIFAQELKSLEQTKLLGRFEKSGSELFRKMMAEPQRYRIQIIYTKIDRDKNGKPHLSHYGYRTDEDWFYPASMVKLPAALISLEKLHELRQPGVHPGTSIVFPPGGCLSPIEKDSSSANGLASIIHYIHKIFLVSDNDAFSRLYEFLGQGYLMNRLSDLGYQNSRIVNRFTHCDEIPDACTQEIHFRNPEGKLIYKIDGDCNEVEYDPPRGEIKLGKAHEEDETGKIVDGSWDFTQSNYLPLWDLHRMLIAVMMPEALEPEQRFRVSPKEIAYIRRSMSMLPGESIHPVYPKEIYKTNHVKYLLFGDGNGPDPQQVRSFNKVGMSFGFLTDCAYIVDYETNTEFFLSAVVYVNDNNIINDSQYEYRGKGMPFLGELGRHFMDFENSRKRKYSFEPMQFEWSRDD